MSIAKQPVRLFGREREQQHLVELIDAAHQGHGSLLLVSGEAGIGKTSLVEEASLYAQDLNMRVAFGRSYDLSATPPYGPWIELLQDVTEPDESSPFDASRHPDIPASASQEGLFHQMRELLSSAAGGNGLLIVLDDAHWADQATLDLLRFLNRSLQRSPTALIIAYRTDELSRHHPLYALIPTLVREARVERLELKPLDPNAVQEWLAKAYALPPFDEDRLLTYLMGNAEGNPFFASEILRTLEEDRVLTRTAGRWALERLPQMTVPLLLQQVIDVRINRLTATARDLLTTAAVVGHDVALDLWARATEVAHEDLIEILEEAEEIWLVVSDVRGERFRFRHSLVREVLYQSISPPRRRIIHQRIAELLAADPNSDPDSVAHHFQQSSDERAIDWLVRAAERAWRTWAWTEAANRYQAAIDLLAPLTARTEERGWLLLRLAEARRYNAPRRALEHVHRAALIAEEAADQVLATAVRWVRGRILVAAEENGLPDLEAAVVAMESFDLDEKQRFLDHTGFHVDHALAILAVWLANFGRYDEALKASADYFASVPEDQRPPLIDAEAFLAMGIASAALGSPQGSADAFQQALDIYLRFGDRLSVGHTAYLFLTETVLPYMTDDLTQREQLAQVGDAAWQQASEINIIQTPIVSPPLLLLNGEWDELRAITGRTVGLRNYVRIWTVLYGAAVARNRGERELANAFVRAVLPPTPYPRESLLWASCSIQSFRLAAELALDARELTQAEHWISLHEEFVDSSQRVTSRAEGALLRARLAQLRGDFADALGAATKALEYGSMPRQPLNLLQAHRALGEILLTLDKKDDAADHLNAALELGKVCSAVYEDALTATIAAQVEQARGNPEQATALFERAGQIARDLDARPLIERIEYLRDQSKPAGEYPDDLTNREVEVLQLITEGRTDGEIADRLSISPRTVMTHVSRILGKTDSPSRAAAAAYAVRQGLA